MVHKRAFGATAFGLVACLAFVGPVAASENVAKPAFDWMANGAQVTPAADRLAEAKLAIRKARALSANATWVCSPAGFGKRSHCERG
jgi:hypothetical protein